MVKQIGSKSEFDQVIRSPQLVVVDFYANWCGPCKMIAPFVDSLEQKFPHVLFVKVDGDQHPDILREMGIRAFPTFLFFINGKKVDEMKGADRNKLESLVQTHTRSAPSASFGSNFSTLSGNTGTPAWDGVGNPPGVDKEAARAARLKTLETAQTQQNKFAAALSTQSQPPVPAPKSEVSKPAAPPTAPIKADDAMDVVSDEDAMLAQALAMSTSSEITGQSADREPKSTSSSNAAVTANVEYDDDTGEELVPVPVNEGVLGELLSMGFADVRARKSVVHGKSLEKALEWLDQHQDDPDIDQPYLVRKSEADREIAKMNAKPLTEEEKKQKLEEMKERIAKRKKEKAEQERKDQIAAEKKRRESGQQMNDIAEDRERMLRMREAERVKKEKADAAKERARLKAEIARDKELRRQNGGMLPSVLGVDGYNPSAAQLETTSASTTNAVPASTASAPAVGVKKPEVKSPDAAVDKSSTIPVPTDSTHTSQVTAEMLDKIDKLIETVARHRVGGDGGQALKLLNTFINNVASNPGEVKYRSINAESNAFKNKLVPLVGSVALLKAVGYVKSPAEEKYIMESANVMLLKITCTKLQAALAKYIELNGPL